MKRTLLLSLLVAACAGSPRPVPLDELEPGKRFPPQLAVQAGHSKPITSVSLSANGRFALTSFGTNILWDTTLGLELRDLPQTSGAILRDDGRVMAGGGYDVKLVDTYTGKILGTLDTGDWGGPLAFLPDHRGLLVSTQSVPLSLWDVTTGKRLRKLDTLDVRWLVVSDDGRWIATVESTEKSRKGAQDLIVRDLATWTELLRSEMPGQASAAFSHDGKTLAVNLHPSPYDEDTKSPGTVSLYALASPGSPTREYKIDHFGFDSMVFSADDQSLLGLSLFEITTLDLASGTLQARHLPALPGAPSVEKQEQSLSADGRILIQRSYSSTWAQVMEIASGKTVALKGVPWPGGAVAFSLDGKSLALERRMEKAAAGVAVLDLSTGRFSRTWDVPTDQAEQPWATERGRLISPVFRGITPAAARAEGERCSENQYAKVASGAPVLASHSESSLVACDLTTGRVLARLDCPGCFVKTVAPDGRWILYIENKGAVRLWNPHTGETRQLLGGNLLFEMKFRYYGATISGDGKRLALHDLKGGPEYQLYDLEAMKLLRTVPGYLALEDGQTSLDRTGELIAIRQDGATSVRETHGGTEVARIQFLEQEWLVAAPDGRYDGSPGASKLVQFVSGVDVIPLESLVDRFYTPGLLGQLLRGEQAPAGVQVATLKPLPRVRITSPAAGALLEQERVTVTVEVDDQGAGVDEVRLFLNGKRVGGDERGFIRPGQAGAPRTFEVTLGPGESQLRAVAVNKERSESLPSVLTVSRRGESPKARLHVLVVGINDYQNARYHLTYARPDAQAMAEALQRHGKAIFQEIVVHELYDAKATRKSVEEQFARISTQASPQDVFVFFFAGHGVMSESEKGEAPDFFLAPYDLTKLYGDGAQLRERAIPASRIRELAQAIPAQKQLLVLDACQSGGAVETFASRGAAEDKAMLQLSRSAGVTLLAASGTDQSAVEFKDLGHGAFTYAILIGLQGEADGGAPPDGKITIRELSAYLDDKVPALTQKYRGASQFPHTFSRGQDFPLGVK